jgi:hypothetical protein
VQRGMESEYAPVLMNNEECGAAPPALDRLPMDPALPGWADFGAGPLGLDCKHRFPCSFLLCFHRNQTGTLGIKSPARHQVLHRGPVVAGA